MRPRIHIVIRITPGIFAHAFDVAAWFPIANTRIGRTCDQRLESLFRRWILEIVETKQVERSFIGANVLLGGCNGGLIDSAHHSRRDERRKNADNHDDYHDFQQRKAAAAAIARKYRLTSNMTD